MLPDKTPNSKMCPQVSCLNNILSRMYQLLKTYSNRKNMRYLPALRKAFINITRTLKVTVIKTASLRLESKVKSKSIKAPRLTQVEMKLTSISTTMLRIHIDDMYIRLPCKRQETLKVHPTKGTRLHHARNRTRTR